MAYLGTLEAVRARLEGNPPQFVAPLPNIDKDWDHQSPDRIAGINAPAQIDADLKDSSSTIVGKISVPIYNFDDEGAHSKQNYPSLTFEIMDVVPRYNEFIFQSDSYQGDVYEIPVTTTGEDLHDVDGTDLGVSPRMIQQRNVEHPMDIMVEIRAYADDPVISAMLVQYVYGIFPPRYFIRVPMKDGSYRSWDMLFFHFKDLDKIETVAAPSPGVQREYLKIWTYRVEGYLDNTDTTEFVNNVRKRKINLDPSPRTAPSGS